MKTKLPILASLVALTLLSASMTKPTQAVISSPKWLGDVYADYDSFHRANVIAYEYNATAILDVTVSNNYVTDRPVNISMVKVSFDWGQDYTSAQTSPNNPFVIPWMESRVITITFKVPSQSEVSNRYMYSYRIYLEHVNSTTAPTEITGSDTLFGGNNFVIYSADQLQAQKTKIIIQEVLDMTSPRNFNSTTAQLLWMKAQNQTFIADMFYSQGDFTEANNHYQSALSLIDQALSEEQTKGGGFDKAQVDLLQAQAKSIEASANYLNGLSNMWVLIGVAAILFAIGYIIRGLGTLRKTTTAPS